MTIVQGFHPESQCFRILEWMRAGNSLTPAEAMSMFDCAVLHSRIAELRHAGWPIETQIVRTATGKHVGCYRLIAA